MNHGYGIERPDAHAASERRASALYLVLIDAGGAVSALLFTAAREQVGEFDAGSEEVAVMTRGLAPVAGASGPEWDRALAGHSAAGRAAAQVYTLDA